jgi:putative cardiolipin synthase
MDHHRWSTAGARPAARRGLLRIAGLWLAAVAGLAGCTALPSLEDRPMSTPIAAPASSALVEAAAKLRADRPAMLNGIHALGDGTDAFAARIALVDAATSSIDVQYYIWHDDLTGGLLLDALRRAADRGVRVRLLLDDNNTSGMDGLLAALDEHPKVELRLFNPFMQRKLRVAGYLSDFARLNRRMHNKALIADGVACVVGGRNIGDEYFDAGAATGFIDLDVVVIGPVVDEVIASFQSFWESGSSHPAERILQAPSPADRERLQTLGETVRRRPEAARYTAAVRDSKLLADHAEGRLVLEWAPAKLVADDPGKGLGGADPADLLVGRLARSFDGEAVEEVLLVSPYFVPGKAGLEALLKIAARGVRVRVLTNALEATDVGAVHAGYARYRKRLLAGGVQIFELRRESAAVASASRVLGGSSGASLHAKTFAVDRDRIFIGSFNFDPRSAIYNTELGLVIRSPRMASELSDLFDTQIPSLAYEVRLDADGDLEWVEREGEVTRVLQREPGRTAFKSLGLGVLSILPIEKLL